MAAEITIHRGNQIGGCITEIATETARILIDFGEELPGSRNEESFHFPWQARPVDAVLFTHYHGDHIGRFAEAYQHAQLYMSELSRDVLINIHGYLAENLPRLAKRKKEKDGHEEAARLLAEAQKHKEALDILEETGIPQDKKRVHTFRPHERTAIKIGDGDIRVTPFWVDHSAGDACMFLIETEDKTVLHTGDFRGHGLLGKEGEDTLLAEVRRLAGEKAIDTLIIEGTMMSRQNEKPYSEEELLETATQFFRDQRNRHAFLIISSTNLDSISTFYQAAQANGIRMYCHNPYVEGQIKTLGEYAHKHWGLPNMNDVERVRMWDSNQQKKMWEEGFVTIIKANELGEELVRQFRDCKPVIIYSMWQGYVWRKLDSALCGFLERCRDQGIPIIPPNTLEPNASPEPRMHTSGHASPELIAEVINAADPGELWPIHTEDAREFLRLDIPEQLKQDLQDRMLEAGETCGYSQEDDHRSLSDAALKKFLPGGTHRAFVELVKTYPQELAFCFRGNSDDAAIIYYKNHAVFHITKSGCVKFNFDHARYMDDWEQQRDWLASTGFSFKDKEVPKKKEYRRKNGEVSVSYSIGSVSMSAQKAKALLFNELEALYFGIRDIIDSFFNAKVNEAFDHFRAEFSEDGEKRGTDREFTEKVVQQNLFLASHDLTDGYFIYDLEFSQPYGKLLGCKNQPDMLAIRFNTDGKPERLVLVEVKSKPEALGGASGLEAHIQGMERYPDWLLPVRGRDACQILNQYITLGLMEEPSTPFAEAEFERLPKEILLIFTGEKTMAKLEELQENDAALLRDYALVTDEFSDLSSVGPLAVYRKDFGQREASVK